MDKKSQAQIKWTFAVGATLLFSFLLALYGKAEARQADSTSPLTLRSVDLGYRSYFHGGRDPLLNEDGILNREPGTALELKIESDVLTYFYWDNVVHALADRLVEGNGGQFRTVGWAARYGVRPLSWLEAGFFHHSQHLLDSDSVGTAYPVEDGFELKIKLFKLSGERESFF